MDRTLKLLRGARVDVVTSTARCSASMEDRASGAVCVRGRKKRGWEEPDNHAVGRSRRGLPTKIRILSDDRGHPLHFHLTTDPAHESTVLDTLLSGDDRVLTNGDNEPVTWPVAMAGDKD